jgi:hypothetical protein
MFLWRLERGCRYAAISNCLERPRAIREIREIFHKVLARQKRVGQHPTRT